MTLDDFFAGRAASRRIFDALAAAVASVGEAALRVSKSQVAFVRRRAFAWAWLPEMYLGRGAQRAGLVFEREIMMDGVLSAVNAIARSSARDDVRPRAQEH